MYLQSKNKRNEVKKMKYYSREVTHREAINKFGKLGTPLYVEFFKTNNEKVVDNFNKGKRIKFAETEDKDLIKILKKSEINKVYAERRKK